jgi:hypothetical protein
VDVIRATVALRDRDLLDVFDLTAMFLGRHPKKLAMVALGGLVPAALALWVARETLEPVGVWLVALLLVPLVETPVVALASRLVFDPDASVGDALRLAARATPRVYLARAASFGAVVAAFLAAVFPAVWVQAVTAFAPEIALLERAGPIAACTRSHRIASGHSGEGIVAVILVVLVRVGLVPLGDHLGRVVTTELLDLRAPPTLLEDSAGAFALAAFVLAAPILALARFFLYLNMRTRSEGWDIQTRFAALARRSDS